MTKYTMPVTKVRLRRYRDIKAYIAEQEEVLAMLNAEKERVIASYSSAPSRGTTDAYRIERYIIECERVKDTIIASLNLNSAELSELYRAVSELDDERERRVLSLYYFAPKRLNWEQVAKKLNVEIATVYRLHGNALKKVLQISKVDSK